MYTIKKKYRKINVLKITLFESNCFFLHLNMTKRNLKSRTRRERTRLTYGEKAKVLIDIDSGMKLDKVKEKIQIFKKNWFLGC